MSPAMTVQNVLAASEQAAVVVVLASVLLWALRIDAPAVRYAIWRTLAAVCLLIPWIQPYHPASTRGVAAVSVVTGTAKNGVAAAPAATHVNGAAIVLAVMTAGALIRLAWLLVGVARLRHLRRDGLIESSPVADDLQRTLGTRAELRYSSRVRQPVTFGLRAPIVLLPESLRGQPLEIQRAVVGHELIHVQRRDWAWLLVEEIALCVFWFHPAAWWVASRIQLAREEVVDELTVLLTGRRKPYVEALLAFSDPLSVVPTAAFARRRHLVRRIALISREDLMSSRRIVASCAVVALVVFLGGWGAVSAFPLRTAGVQAAQLPTGPGPIERRAHAVTPENPVPRRSHYEPPIVPDIAESASANVALKITVDEAGMVAEARPVSFRIKDADTHTDVGFTDDNLAARMAAIRGFVDQGTAHGIASARTYDVVVALLDSAVTAVKGWRYDPPALAPLTFSVSIRYGDADSGVSGGVPGGVPSGVAGGAAKTKVGFALRVGGDIKPPVKSRDVRPVYPPDALAAGIQGVVIMEARIGADGSVEDAHVLKSIPELDQAAIDAVRQWKFVPTLINGQPVPVIMTVTINFTKD